MTPRTAAHFTASNQRHTGRCSPYYADSLPAATRWYARESSSSGVHAAAFAALILTSRRRDAWLGGAIEGDDSFPPMDGEHLAASLIFFAALTSRS